MATGRVNVGGGGSGLNVYAQTTEPSKKEGIWIQTDKPIKNIINDLTLWFADAWNDESKKQYASAPYPISYSASYFAVDPSNGTDVYVAGGGNSSATQIMLHKYDVLTDTWTRLADLPERFAGGKGAIVDGKFYIMTSSLGSTISTAYIYDIKSNTWTKSSKGAPYAMICGAVAVGTNIYILGSTTSTYARYFYKYDTISDTWTKLTDYPTSFTYGAIVSIGTKIYAMGGGNSTTIYCYDTELKTWTTLPRIPFEFSNGSAVAVGTDIYVMGSDYSISVNKMFYKYDTVNSIWTKLPDLQYEMANQISYYSDNGIYTMGGTLVTKNIKFNFKSKVYPDRTVILYRTNEYYGVYKAELVTNAQQFGGVNTRMLTGFDNVYMYIDGTLKESLQTYYGDGTKWIKFKGA